MQSLVDKRAESQLKKEMKIQSLLSLSARPSARRARAMGMIVNDTEYLIVFVSKIPVGSQKG